MILHIKHTVEWELISKQNQTQINKCKIRKNIKLFEHDYKAGDKVILYNRSTYKYEILYKGPFVITRCWTNVTVIIQYDRIQIRHNIHRIKPYKSDKNVEYINPRNMCDDVIILSPVIYSYIILNIGNKVYNRYMHEDLGIISYRLCT